MAQAIADEKNELWLSPISLWETHLLAEKGRLILEPSPEQWIADSLQKLDTKIDSDILECFKSQGVGYQNQINQLLRNYIEAHQL